MQTPLLIMSLVIAIATPASDNRIEGQCVGSPHDLPVPLDAWDQRTPINAGVKPGEGATLALGRSALVSLHPSRHLAFRPASGRNEGQGGTLTLGIIATGTYRAAIGNDAAFILLENGKPIAPTAQRGAINCAGVRQILDFRLTPGNYVIQLSGSDTDSVTLLMVKTA